MRILAIAWLTGLALLLAACSSGSESTGPSTPAEYTVLGKIRDYSSGAYLFTIWLHGAEREVEVRTGICATAGAGTCNRYCHNAPIGSVLPARCR